MTNSIPSHLTSLIRNRQALLWICQSRDLNVGEKTHECDLDSTEAVLRYRTEPDNVDKRLAAHYWLAVWTESPMPQLLSAIQQTTKDAMPATHRRPVLLASNADIEATLSPHEFLSFAVLPGIIDKTSPKDSQYGILRKRARERVAWGLAERLRLYPGTILVVLGAKTNDDLRFLYELLEGRPCPGLHLFVVQEPQCPELALPETTGVEIDIWKGSLDAFCDQLDALGAPAATDIPEWTVRMRNGGIRLNAGDIGRITEQFVLITERDLVVTQEFAMSDLETFFAGSLTTWKGYTVGLPFQRAYRSEQNTTLDQEILSALTALMEEGTKPTARIIELPCQGGGGTTTLIRGAAFKAASEGFPTIVLKPDQTDLASEVVLGFVGNLAEKTLAIENRDIPPLALFFDVEHTAIMEATLYKLGQSLVANGRRAVLVLAKTMEVGEGGQTPKEARGARRTRLKPLLAQVDPIDLEKISTGFRELVERWHLPVTVPSQSDWEAYEKATRWNAEDLTHADASLFWVGLHFLVTSGMSLHDADRVKIALGEWINKRAERASGSSLAQVVDFVAVLSSWHIISPLWSVLRPVTGGTFSSELVSVLKDLGDLVNWGDYNPVIDDQTIYFRHPVLAAEFLRRRSVSTDQDRVECLMPMLRGMSTGHNGDMWVAETLAYRVLTPPFAMRVSAGYEWRLKAFEAIPPSIRDHNKTILHHWARCLYQSVQSIEEEQTRAGEPRRRYELAIDKLRTAVTMPRKSGRDENPSHLANTLGTAYYRYAKWLESERTDHAEIESAWNSACGAFRDAIDLSGGMNIEAILAFSQRLLEKLGVLGTEQYNVVTEANIADLAEVLSLLDRARDALEVHTSPDPDWEYQVSLYRTKALERLKGQDARVFVEDLVVGRKDDLGFYCKAVLLAGGLESQTSLFKAHELLLKAKTIGVTLSWRTLQLWLSIIRHHEKLKRDYVLQLNLHDALERCAGYTQRPIEGFRQAVLCYQTGDYQKGSERFRRLREIQRDPDAIRVFARDVWRDNNNQDRPRETFIRVVRIVTEWRAEGFVDDLNQKIPVRPRHFTPILTEGQVAPCIIRFESSGPLAVPVRFASGRDLQ